MLEAITLKVIMQKQIAKTIVFLLTRIELILYFLKHLEFHHIKMSAIKPL